MGTKRVVITVEDRETIGIGWVYSGRIGGEPHCLAVHFLRDGGEKTVCGRAVYFYWETDCIDKEEFAECFNNYCEKCRRGIRLHPELIGCVSPDLLIMAGEKVGYAHGNERTGG